MLVIRRNAGESIRIGDQITIEVSAIEGKQVKLAIDAPKSLKVQRAGHLEPRQAQER